MKFKDLIKEEGTAFTTTTSIGNSSSIGGSANHAKRMNIGTSFVGKTSKDAGHDHDAYVDEKGNGNTSPGKKNGHTHKISNWNVLPADSDKHDHVLLRNSKRKKV